MSTSFEKSLTSLAAKLHTRTPVLLLLIVFALILSAAIAIYSRKFILSFSPHPDDDVEKGLSALNKSVDSDCFFPNKACDESCPCNDLYHSIKKNRNLRSSVSSPDMKHLSHELCLVSPDLLRNPRPVFMQPGYQAPKATRLSKFAPFPSPSPSLCHKGNFSGVQSQFAPLDAKERAAWSQSFNVHKLFVEKKQETPKKKEDAWWRNLPLVTAPSPIASKVSSTSTSPDIPASSSPSEDLWWKSLPTVEIIRPSSLGDLNTCTPKRDSSEQNLDISLIVTPSTPTAVRRSLTSAKATPSHRLSTGTATEIPFSVSVSSPEAEKGALSIRNTRISIASTESTELPYLLPSASTTEDDPRIENCESPKSTTSVDSIKAGPPAQSNAISTPPRTQCPVSVRIPNGTIEPEVKFRGKTGSTSSKSRPVSTVAQATKLTGKSQGASTAPRARPPSSAYLKPPSRTFGGSRLKVDSSTSKPASPPSLSSRPLNSTQPANCRNLGYTRDTASSSRRGVGSSLCIPAPKPGSQVRTSTLRDSLPDKSSTAVSATTTNVSSVISVTRGSQNPISAAECTTVKPKVVNTIRSSVPSARSSPTASSMKLRSSTTGVDKDPLKSTPARTNNTLKPKSAASSNSNAKNSVNPGIDKLKQRRSIAIVRDSVASRSSPSPSSSTPSTASERRGTSTLSKVSSSSSSSDVESSASTSSPVTRLTGKHSGSGRSPIKTGPAEGVWWKSRSNSNLIEANTMTESVVIDSSSEVPLDSPVSLLETRTGTVSEPEPTGAFDSHPSIHSSHSSSSFSSLYSLYGTGSDSELEHNSSASDTTITSASEAHDESIEGRGVNVSKEKLSQAFIASNKTISGLATSDPALLGKPSSRVDLPPPRSSSLHSQTPCVLEPANEHRNSSKYDFNLKLDTSNTPILEIPPSLLNGHAQLARFGSFVNRKRLDFGTKVQLY